MSIIEIGTTTASYSQYETNSKKTKSAANGETDKYGKTTSSSKTASSNTTTSNNTKSSDKTTTNDTAAAVYEPSSKTASNKLSNYPEIVAQLKADSEARMTQMQSLVQKMFEKQGIAIGTTDDMWKILASGNFTADAETVEQAKKDISEDGYWGVSQTAERIYSFAMALSGGDETQMQKMKEAVEKGFKAATKSWGKELPSISNDTYNTVMKKFDDFFNKNSDTESDD